MKRIIKNALVYSVKLPHAAAMEECLKLLPHSEMSPHSATKSAFVPHPVTGALVTHLHGGLAFMLRRDEKVVPKSAVMELVAQKLAAMDVEKPGTKLMAELKEDALSELLPQALIRTAFVDAFYHPESGTLAVNTPSKQKAGIFNGALLHCVEAMESTTLNISGIKRGLTTRLREYLEANNTDAFGEFELGNRVQLSGPNRVKAVFHTADMQGAHDGILEAFRTGAMEVDRIDLGLGPVQFALTHDFQIKQIHYEEDAAEEAEDVIGAWIIEASAQMMMLVGAVQELVKAFQRKEDQDGN
jgi:recombination associated protein RdgC